MREQRSHRNVKLSMATVFPSLFGKQDLNANVYMFTQDIYSGIMPIGGRTDKQQDFIVTLEGEDSECEKAKTILGQLCEYDKHSVSEMLCDAISEVTRNLVSTGQVFYEVSEDDEKIYIDGFTSINIFRIFSWYLQIIPAGDWDLWKKKYTLVNKKKIWSIQIPHHLGGKKEYRKIMRKLRKNRYLGPKFYEEDLANGKNSKNYNAIRYINNNDVYINKVTKKWHWNRRDLSPEKFTEFYMCYKMVGFRLAQAILREHITSEINKLLSKLSVDCKIVMTGLPTPDDILQVRSDMENGTIDFPEALDRVTI